MRTINLNNVTQSDAAQSILMLQGNPYSLKRYPMFVAILNSPYRRRMMRAGRQVSKTITMAADMLTEAALVPFLPVLYSNASGQQTRGFSRSKLDPFIVHSPVISYNLIDRKNGIDNVYHKRFKNFSEIMLTYFSESADRIRGNTAFRYYADEVQDVLYDAMIDAEECLSSAEAPRFMYAGTSKTMISTLEFLWEQSTQKMWIIKCEGCNKWNVPSVENIGKKGLICKKCGHDLNTFEGQWHAFKKSENVSIDGFHIPQIIMPMHCCVQEKWDALLVKKNKYPEYKFLNEVMGIPLGEGDSIITESMLREHSVETLRLSETPLPAAQEGATYFVAGIDWGGGGTSGVSRTVISIFAVFPEEPRFLLIYAKIFSGGEPSRHVQEIAHYIQLFGVTIVYGDHGGGHFAMNQLSRFLPGMRVVPVKYAEQKVIYRWEERGGRYSVDRTSIIDEFLSDYKMGRIETFRWEDFELFARDILNVKEELIGEELGKGKRVWRHYPSKPDDSLHSMVFGWFGCRMMCGRIDMRMTAQSDFDLDSPVVG